MQAEKRHEYLALDAIRGVAALIVMLGHAKLLPWEDANFYGGYLAVDLFFLLSGFVVARAYAGRLELGLSPLDFMLIRLIRLWPMILLGTALGLIRVLLFPIPSSDTLQGAQLWAVALLNLCFVPVWPGHHRMLFPLDDPAWSLFFELVVNLGFALGLYRLSGRRGWTVVALCALPLIACAWHYRSLNAGWESIQYPAGVARSLFSFTLGLMLFRSRGAWMSRKLRISPAILGLIVIVLMAVPGAGPLRGLYDALFVLFVSPLIVMAGACTEPGPRAQRIAAWLGLISYPLYAIHFPLVRMLDSVEPGPGAAHALLGTGLVIVVVALCAPLARLYETPVRMLLTRSIRRRPVVEGPALG